MFTLNIKKMIRVISFTYRFNVTARAFLRLLHPSFETIPAKLDGSLHTSLLLSLHLPLVGCDHFQNCVAKMWRVSESKF